MKGEREDEQAKKNDPAGIGGVDTGGDHDITGWYDGTGRGKEGVNSHPLWSQIE